MSSQTIKERLPVSGIDTSRATSWIGRSWKKLLGAKKQLIIGGAALAVLGVAAFYFWGNQSSAPQYMTAKVERGNLRNTVTATGTLQAVTTVQVGSQASGTISALYADFNSVVKKGQVIAQLDPSVAKAQVDQARANLEQARASLAAGARRRCRIRAPASATRRRKRWPRSRQCKTIRPVCPSAQANVAVLKAQQDDALSLLETTGIAGEERRDRATRLRHRKHCL